MRFKELYYFLSPRYKNLFLEYKVDFTPRYGHGKPAHPELEAWVESGRKTYREFLGKTLDYKERFLSILDSSQESDPSKPSWNNGYLPGLDILTLYTMIAEFKPETYVEIGSGNSTKVAHKAITEQALHTEVISIDPCPRAEIDQLASKIIRQPFETVDHDFLTELGENDILFVDNSHRILPNSDANVFFLEVLPRLNSGVIVHVHDIYIPYDYPDFMSNRFYSEQYGLSIALLSSPEKFKPLLANYFISENEELREILAPVWEMEQFREVERHGGSFWFKIL